MAGVQVFDRDPELLADVEPAAAAWLRRHGRARAISVERGPWRSAPHAAGPADLGLLVIDGFLVAEMTIGGGASAELLGPGDLIRTWERRERIDSVPSRVVWHGLQPATLAVLDARFVALTGDAPSVMVALLDRAVDRSRSLATSLAVATLPRAVDRLDLIFRDLADRFGCVTPAGVVVPVRLTHAVLARMACLRRPSASTALGRLARAGMVVRRDDGTWLLRQREAGVPRAASGLREAVAPA